MLSKIYNSLIDEESRELFKARLLYSLTGDYEDMVHMVSVIDSAKELRYKLREAGENGCVLWGTGYWGTMFKRGFSDIAFKCYFDNAPKESEKEGIPVYHAKEFNRHYQGEAVMIATVFHNDEIEEQLLSYGVDKNKIVKLGAYMVDLEKRQYFDLPYLPHDTDEVFIDVGCFDGYSVRNFIDWSKGNYKEIISFEPDHICYPKCKEALKDVDNYTIINKGLWSSETTLYFRETGASDSTVSESGEVEIHTCRLDEELKDKKVTFIKMDIEGAEKEALLGAEKIIREQKPKLAISIYHKNEDIWEIPSLILEMNPEYRFYIRHYSFRFAETVLYAF